jgi:hypothetical protein
MDRIKKADLKRRLDRVNDALGNPMEAYTMTEEGFRANAGTITLDWAYGGVRVCRIAGPTGGETDLSLRGTMRETATYLDAMLVGINIANGKTK